MLFWLLVSLIVVLGGAGAVGSIYAANDKRRRALPPSTTRALPGGDKLIERTIRDLRIGDVVTIDARDYLCEGVIHYDEDGHRWTGSRLVDGNDTRWCVVGLERSGVSPVRLLTLDDSGEINSYPPEAIVLAETRYTLDKRGTATCKLSGDLGMGSDRRPDGSVERCRWWLYSAPGDATAIVEQWGQDYRVLRGKKVSGDTIDLIPGS